MVTVVRLNANAARERLSGLAEVLFDCVEGGASVSFMPPFSREDAAAFFTKAIDDVEAGERILLAALKNDVVVGSVQILTAMPPNQPHRADVAKLLVHRHARGAGLARLLMEEAEREARQAEKTLLVLDTVTGGIAEGLYSRLGWQRVGVIPDYALMPDGTLTPTTVFYKSLA